MVFRPENAHRGNEREAAYRKLNSSFSEASSFVPQVEVERKISTVRVFSQRDNPRMLTPKVAQSGSRNNEDTLYPGDYRPFGFRRIGRALLEGVTLGVVVGVVGAAAMAAICALLTPIMGIVGIPAAALGTLHFSTLGTFLYTFVNYIPSIAAMFGAMGASIWSLMSFANRMILGTRLGLNDSTDVDSTMQWALSGFKK